MLSAVRRIGEVFGAQRRTFVSMAVLQVLAHGAVCTKFILEKNETRTFLNDQDDLVLPPPNTRGRKTCCENTGERMKKLALAILLAAPMAASAKTVTVEVCDSGESGTQCRVVTYKVRPASTPVVEKCMVPVGEAAYAPCPTVVGVPKWLKDLNAWFNKHGIKAADPQAEIDAYARAGGN